MDKVLLLGSAGMLGSALQVNLLKSGMSVVARTKSNYNITDNLAFVNDIQDIKPTYVVNAAAYTAVDLAEVVPSKALEVNGTAPTDIARTCKENNVKLLHISSDYVFTGSTRELQKEGASLGPVNSYGWSKLVGDRGIEAVFGMDLGYHIVRTSWLFGPNGNNFIKTLLYQYKYKKVREFKVVCDQYGSPTYTNDLAKAIIPIIKNGNDGTPLYNICNRGVLSWYDLAVEVFTLAGIDDVDIIPIPSSQSNRLAKRATYTALDCTMYERSYGRLPYFRGSLSHYIGLIIND
jgi:dTDP-4-dehydrorhamnose reductase